MPEPTAFAEAVIVDAQSTKTTSEGYLIATARSVRTGIQEYAGSEVGKPDMDVVRIYRPRDEVFSTESLQTFSHAPVTLGHPSENVTSDNWREHAVGEVSTAALPDGEWVQLPLILKDADAIKAVQDGVRELSAGYRCVIDWTPGQTEDGEQYDARQTSIRANHLALVSRARAGRDARIADNAPWGAVATVPTEEKPAMANQTVVVDGLSIETTAQGAEAIAKLQKTIADGEAELAKRDAELAKRDAKIDELSNQVVDGAALDQMVADRAALIESAKLIDKDFKPSGSAADIRRAVVTKAVGATVADKSDDYIAARFDALVDTAKKSSEPKDPVSDLARYSGFEVSDAQMKAKQAQDKRKRDMSKAWEDPTTT